MRRSLPLFITLAALAIVAPAARAQTLPIALPSAAPSLPPGVRVEGIYQTAPVRLDGQTLFRIASSLNAPGAMTAESRAGIIEDVFEEMLAKRTDEANSATLFDPRTVKIAVQPDGLQAILSATDSRHTLPFPIMTVTTVDARYQRSTVDVLASRWRDVLQAAFVAALEKRQPGQVQRNATDVARIAIALVLATLIVVILNSLIGKRIRVLEKEIDRAERTLEHPEGDKRLALIDLALSIAEPRTRITFFRAISALLRWATVLAWFVAILWGLSLFPQTSQLAQTIGRRAARIVFVWIAAILLVRIIDLLLARSASVARGHLRARDMKEDEKARQLLRVPTLVNGMHNLFFGIIVFAAGLATMSALGLPIASVLTIGGLVAFAVTFAAQNLVRDFLNGILVLVEDQYVIGDYVIVGEYSGLVEAMTLRILQIRDASGNLVTIPFGSASVVVNCSRYWSRIDYRVAIAADADAQRALAAVRRTLEELSRDAQWRDTIVEPFEWVGIENVGAAGIVLRASIRTAPLRQFELRREINARVVEAFRAEGIGLGADPTLTAVPVRQR